MEAACLLCLWPLVYVRDTMRENEWFACVFAAVIFCPMYSCYISVFLSWIHTNTNCAAISNITSCLSEWRSLCHKYFIMPLGICPRPLKTRTQTLLFDFSALKFQWVAGLRKHSVSCLTVFVEDFCCLLSWSRLALCYIKTFDNISDLSCKFIFVWP